MSAFALPNFNLTARVWHAPARILTALGPPSLTTACNLANGRVAHIQVEQKRLVTQNALGASASLLFPALTDIRDASVFSNPDVIECPALSGRYYWVAFCDDIAKGFANEHRWAICPKAFTDGWFQGRWPTPMT